MYQVSQESNLQLMILTEKKWFGLESIECILVHKQCQEAEYIPHNQG